MRAQATEFHVRTQVKHPSSGKAQRQRSCRPGPEGPGRAGRRAREERRVTGKRVEFGLILGCRHSDRQRVAVVSRNWARHFRVRWAAVSGTTLRCVCACVCFLSLSRLPLPYQAVSHTRAGG